LKSSTSKAHPGVPESAGAEGTADGERLRQHFRSVDGAFTEAIARGLAHLTAEDQQLSGRTVTLHGRRHVNFGSCSYVGLETDLRLKNAACDAVGRYGVQFASSRAYVSCPPYRELERLLGAIFGAPLVVAQTTTLAHFAALPVLVRQGDAVICDQLVHSSVQAVLPTLGAAGATCRFVRHNRMDRLEEMVVALSRRHARVWYLGDGIYSMHGDAAPIDALHDLRSRHERLHLYLDDAHGMSWTGTHGRGHVLGTAPIPPRTIVVVSLAKAFAASGAALLFPDAESARLVRTCGSTLIFSGPLQPALLGAAIASAHVHLSSEIYDRQQKLHDRIRLFNDLAIEKGLPLASPAATPIRFITTGGNGATYRLASALMNEGYYTNAAVFPAVSVGRGGLRIALTVHHTFEDIRGLVTSVERLLERRDRPTSSPR
jgi:7-keto-8-aminopelargonate synthetase-like enzyme